MGSFFNKNKIKQKNKISKTLIINNLINNKIEQLNERFSNTSLGVCLIGQAPVWTKNFTLYSVTNTRVIAPVSLSDTDFKSLNKILDNFTCSMFSLF